MLLYCGDHDPGGLNISGLPALEPRRLSRAVGWSPENLIIDRSGSTLTSSSAAAHVDRRPGDRLRRRLDDPRHPDHGKPYVQDYLRRFGARKVEANALVVRPEAGRELCRQAILQYVPEDAPARYEAALREPREQLRQAIVTALQQESAP